MRLIWRYAVAAMALTALAGGPALADIAVYGDALAAGWQDWSWGGVTRDFARTTPVHAGSAAIAVTYTGGWSGLQLGRNDAVDTSGFDVLRCWVHGGSAGGQPVQVEVGNHLTGASTRVSVTPQANAWTRLDVPLAPLGTSLITYMFWFDNSATAQPQFFVDDVAFVASGNPTPTPPGPVSGPALAVNVAAGRHPISPYVYGMNFTDEPLAAELRLPVRRWGGNATTRYNWQTDTSNHASDWYFENIPNDNANPAALPNGSSTDQFVDQDDRTGTATLLTMPLIGWTPHGRAYACGFSIAKYGAQQSADPYRPDCGNGVRSSGADVTGNDPHDTSDPITPTFVQAWIAHLIGRYGTAATGGVPFYDLDNEPMLWSDTHRDVHPLPLGYDELRDRTIAYAAAIKAADPSARTLGPAEWGWTNYFWSALDAAPGGAWWNNPQDRLAHGNEELVAWYLDQLHAYEQQNGVRLLDYLDLHYYPQASGVSLSGAGSPGTQALRLRSTRSLWDASYVDESWIGEAVRLLPRMHDWVAQHYPGTKLAITEYNWGALDHISGALAQADVLGIFGREGVDLATLWDPPTAAEPGAFAFRMYRNYDGAGAAFGDVAVSATSADEATVALYAAQRSGDGAVTLLAINKSVNPRTSTVSISGFTGAAAAAVYRYSTANLAAIMHLTDQPIAAGSFTATLTANSITLFVLEAGGASATPSFTPTVTPAPPTSTSTRPPATSTATPRPPTPTATRPPSTSTATRPPATATATATARRTHRVAGTIHYYGSGQPVGAALAELQGDSVMTATSAADGSYVRTDVAEGAWTIAPRKIGDRGPAVSALDAAHVLQAVAGRRTLDARQRLAADVTGDGTVSALDATRILQLAVGAIPQLPAAQLCNSEWLFLAQPAAAPPASAVAPSFTGSTCQPGAITIPALSVDATGENFDAVLIGDVTGNWSP